MRWLLFFGLILCVIGDLLFLNGEYTHVVTSGLAKFGDAIRNSSASLWGVN